MGRVVSGRAAGQGGGLVSMKCGAFAVSLLFVLFRSFFVANEVRYSLSVKDYSILVPDPEYFSKYYPCKG